MAKQQVVESTCDRCHKETTNPLSPNNRRGEDFEVPDGWIHVSANSKTKTIFEMDLCDECKGTVLDAAGAAR
jgi:hypothetical protein